MRRNSSCPSLQIAKLDVKMASAAAQKDTSSLPSYSSNAKSSSSFTTSGKRGASDSAHNGTVSSIGPRSSTALDFMGPGTIWKSGNAAGMELTRASKRSDTQNTTSSSRKRKKTTPLFASLRKSRSQTNMNRLVMNSTHPLATAASSNASSTRYQKPHSSSSVMKHHYYTPSSSAAAGPPYSSASPVTDQLLASLRLPPQDLQKIRSQHLKKLSDAVSSGSKYRFEYKYAALLNKKNGFYEKKRRRKRYSPSSGVLAKLYPLNAQEEKEKFLRAFKLGLELKNPKFKFQKKFLASTKSGKKSSATFQENVYNSSHIEEGTHPYNFVCTEYLPIAKRIMNKMKKQYGSLHNYYMAMGERISSEDALNYFAFYLRDQGLSRLGISLEVTEAAASPTFCKGKKLIIRVPMKNYRMARIQGVAHHEVSTHLIRYINDSKQIWHKKKNSFGFRSHMMTEEGLATVNSCVHSPHKLLCHSAIHYYAVVQASRMNFVELFQDLYPWIGDEDRTWTECIRVKRGISASRPGGAFSKDQIYLKGVCILLRKRRKLDFRLLYSGKLALEDLPYAQQNGVDLDELILPKFIQQDFKGYMQALDELASVNGIK